jgi:hypothetical protein
MRCLMTITLLSLLAGAIALAADEVPPRSAGGQTLVVPPAQLALGEVYHVDPGTDTQIVCRLRTSLSRVAAVSNRAVGYLIAPFDLDSSASPILAGALRIPVASLASGMEPADAQLHGPRLLDSGKFPEITVRLDKVRDVKLEKEEGGRRSFTLNADVELQIKDQTLTQEIPLQVLHVPFTWGTMNRNLGDLLIVRGSLELKLADCGIAAPGPREKDFVPTTADVDVFLLCTTVSPEKVVDPKIKLEDYLKQLQFLTRLRDFNDPEPAYALGREYMQTIWKDPLALNRLAYATLTEPGIQRRDLRFVLDAATRANELAESQDPAVLHTLARAEYERGDLPAALKWARLAVQHIDQAPKESVEDIRAALARYEGQASKISP